MVRIIPWDLPPIEGGSIGGYTPAPTPEPPAVKYLDFDNVDISVGGTPDKVTCRFNYIVMTPNTATELTLTSYVGTLSGISSINLVGVSSITVRPRLSTDSENYTINSEELLISVDPVTLSGSFVSGKLNVTAVSNYAWTQLSLDITEYDCYVYNSNGEIIQTETIEVGE